MEQRILQFNHRQRIRAVVAAALGPIATVLTFLFFRLVASQVFLLFDMGKARGWSALIGAGIVGFVFWEGLRRSRRGEGTYGFEDSSGYLNLDRSQGGAWYVQYTVGEITGPAYMLTQIFLCAPLQVNKCLMLLGSFVPPDADTPGRLQALLGEILKKPTWQPVRSFADRQSDLRRLIDMELVEFSATKGLIQPSEAAKGETDHGL